METEDRTMSYLQYSLCNMKHETSLFSFNWVSDLRKCLPYRFHEVVKISHGGNVVVVCFNNHIWINKTAKQKTGRLWKID